LKYLIFIFFFHPTPSPVDAFPASIVASPSGTKGSYIFHFGPPSFQHEEDFSGIVLFFVFVLSPLFSIYIKNSDRRDLSGGDLLGVKLAPKA